MAKEHQVSQVVKVVKEVGSRVNKTRTKLLKLLANISVTMIAIEHKDILIRFGFKHIETLLATRGRRIEAMNLSTKVS